MIAPIGIIIAPFRKRGARLSRLHLLHEKDNDYCVRCDRTPAPRWKKYKEWDGWMCALCAEKIEREEKKNGTISVSSFRDDRIEPVILDSNELRFWRQANYSSGATCRLCDGYYHSVEARQVHMQLTQHNMWLCKAYRILKNWNKCVVCKESVRRGEEKWGVPLHMRCHAKWSQGWGKMELLTLALDAVREEARPL